ncbi:Helix-turn-helix [Kaistia soli DSM 19436]|uniref:Helix-turn-helix n=1 Tax=Kaistia soli DSM 19436 TaxID=1122133 RepID=A0A1M4VCV5_9HYPH|nr:helix-turn-helix transcriptional regulator [Kaistia soli]SHE66727.1 Helix-turn-helix [Kaistia soli DSM 19436]
MKLSTYLEDNKLTHSAFAERIGVSQGAVTRYANGARLPRPAVMACIRQATAGAVTYRDFLEEPEAAE